MPQDEARTSSRLLPLLGLLAGSLGPPVRNARPSENASGTDPASIGIRQGGQGFAGPDHPSWITPRWGRNRTASAGLPSPGQAPGGQGIDPLGQRLPLGRPLPDLLDQVGPPVPG